MNKSIVLLSGGIDSVALLHDRHQQGDTVHAVSFDYGQAHRDELRLARLHAQKLSLEHTIVELLQIKNLFLHCSITDGKGGDVVPNRNAVFLNIAAAIAESTVASSIYIGCNKTDARNFPDCRATFIDSINETLFKAGLTVRAHAPYINMTKRDIVLLARSNQWPIEESISCYKGTNCGKCKACKERARALQCFQTTSS